MQFLSKERALQKHFDTHVMYYFFPVKKNYSACHFFEIGTTVQVNRHLLKKSSNEVELEMIYK